jgi:transcriptional regulator of arginine metabolism
MKAKTDRLLVLKQIIETQRISKQEDLLHRLQNKGFELTQATLSRNLKQLKAVKIPDSEFGYVYSIPKNGSILPVEKPKHLDYQSLGFKSIANSGNMVVIRTKSGYADRLSAIIDEFNFYEILGTIAGSDTIFAVLREGVRFQDFKNALILNIPELREI